MMFGREPDLDHLLTRCQQTGLTVVAGRPKLGKTWLLQEFGRRATRERYLVGYHECFGESDQTLHVVADTYTRWLSSAGMLDQAHSLWERHKDSLITRAGQAVGALFSKLAACQGAPAPLAELVKMTFHGLAQADRDLKTASLPIAPLPYDVARELISILARITEKPPLLVFDAWEQSASIKKDRKILSAFLSHPEDWPRCHIILGLKHPEIRGPHLADRGYEAAKDLCSSAPITAELYDLPPMHLETALEQHNLTAFVRTRIPHARQIADANLLSMVQGFPGVLDFWSQAAQQINSDGEMEKMAEDAHAHRYREFDVLLRNLPPAEHTLAIRLAVAPRLDASAWSALQAVLLDGCARSSLDQLAAKRVLEAGDPPGYGHETRHSAARRRFLTEYQYETADETNDLLLRLAEHVRSAELLVLPFFLTILAMSEFSFDLELTPAAKAVSLSALSLYELRIDPGLLLECVRAARASPQAAPLLSMGLLSTLESAKEENDLQRRDDLLAELRVLAQAHPEEPAVRQSLALGLSITLFHASQENDLQRRDDLLTELRNLAQARPQEAAVREQLAKGLFNTLNDAKAENDLQRRDDLLAELRNLAQAHPQEPAVRKQLAMGLSNALTQAGEENDLQRRDGLLGELRALAQALPEEPAVRKQLAKGLFNTLIHAKAGSDLERRNQLLAELRTLAQDHPEHPVVAFELAMGLCNTLIHAREENDLQRRDTLLAELCVLAEDHPEEPAVRQLFEHALRSTC